MSKTITFTNCHPGLVNDLYFPSPSSKNLPSWYKETNSYVNGKTKKLDPVLGNTSTIKRCMPVTDMLSTGYTIVTYQDINIYKDESGTIHYSSNILEIPKHDVFQFLLHPFNKNNQPAPKIINPWSIKTPPGYSCLFIPPPHGGNKYFTILEGVVDTDKYYSPVNFPFMLNDLDFEGIIPAGTPVAVVIPFKREEWTMKKGNEKDVQKSNSVMNLLNSIFFDRYKNLFWSPKRYK
jgi:hypothetical protein